MKNATQFSSAHETKPGNPKNEKVMDSHNNTKEIEIGGSHPNASDDEHARVCQNALLNEELKVIKQ